MSQRLVLSFLPGIIKTSIAISCLLLACSNINAAPRIVKWTEQPGELGLGYPVPKPVDTPLPFDGFRSYNGLRARHFELAASTKVVHRKIIGTTQKGSSINAWQMGDADLLNNEGLPEAAMLTNGGIHAREWQSPEVVTGIMELLAANEEDNGFYRYLLDNANIILIPSLNIDGFKQTQRYPEKNWIDTDPNDPQGSPRDGRMRRKNMRSVDGNLSTQGDHLFGVDLNRNNPPFYASSNRSSANTNSIVHHGVSAHSEGETQALAFAATLGPEDRLRMYTDVHSFSQVHFWHHTGSNRLALNTVKVLRLFSDHHAAFPAAKEYPFSQPNQLTPNRGIGSTDEYFAQTYKIPSWTLEVEPSGGNHTGLPGSGADYGGFASNGHDGFILPESEIRRVRETLAQSFSIAYYKQMGAASVRRVRIINQSTGAVVYAADWVADSPGSRLLHASQVETLVPGNEYRLWVAFNKPMRQRDQQGKVVALQGMPRVVLDNELVLHIDGQELEISTTEIRWLEHEGLAPEGYLHYRDDAYSLEFSITDTQDNRDLIATGNDFTLSQTLRDLGGDLLDANPGTVVNWDNGGWSRLENSNGVLSETGGTDSTLKISVSSTASEPSLLIGASMSAAWPDFNQDKQGLLLEILDNDKAVIYWFTYDHEGNQRYLNAVGTILGNRIVFAELVETRGGSFSKPGFEPEYIVAGQAEIIFTSCDSGRMDYTVDSRSGHLDIGRLTNLMGYDCGLPKPGAPVRQEMQLSGAWINNSSGNHGLIVEVLRDSQIVAYWFSYDNQGNQRWFFGVGKIEADELVFDEVYTTRGGIFGKPAVEAPAELLPWGAMRLQLNCTGGMLNFNADNSGMGNGQFPLDRLTVIRGTTCLLE
ncbi:MAG: hypothetical protein IMF09_06990 [Proteobacteria bacterium]|nr:hypothetical protein [Pseudomonadota bacterium]